MGSLSNLVLRLRTEAHNRPLLISAFWSMIGEGIAKGLMLLSLLVLARILDPTGYGELGLVRTTSALLATLGGMGLGLTANRFVAEHRKSDRKFCGEVIGSSYLLALCASMFIAALLYAGAPFLAARILNQPEAYGNLRFACFLLILSALNGAQIGVLQGFGRFRDLAVCGFIQAAIGLAAMISGALWIGVEGALAGLLAHGVAGVLVSHVVIARILRESEVLVIWRIGERMRNVLFRFSAPLVLMFLLVAPMRWLGETQIVRSSGFGELGLFHAAMVIVNVIIVIASTLNAPLITISAGRARSTFSHSMSYANLYGSWFVFFLLALPLLAFPGIAFAALGSSFRSDRFLTTCIILMGYAGLLLLNQGIGRLITLHGSMWFGLVTNAVEGLCLVAGVFALMHLGVVGISIAYVLSMLARVIVSVPYLVRTGIVPLALFADRIFLCSLILYLAVSAIRVF